MHKFRFCRRSAQNCILRFPMSFIVQSVDLEKKNESTFEKKGVLFLCSKSNRKTPETHGKS